MVQKLLAIIDNQFFWNYIKVMKKKEQKNKTDALSGGDIDRIGNLLDNRLAPMDKNIVGLDKKLAHIEEVMATKIDLKNEITASEARMKDYIHEGVETIMDGMNKLSEELAEKQRVDRLENWTKKIAQKVGVKLV
jgi:hypothetical protein